MLIVGLVKYLNTQFLNKNIDCNIRGCDIDNRQYCTYGVEKYEGVKQRDEARKQKHDTQL